jgi:RNA polymerase sigma-32 factor
VRVGIYYGGELWAQIRINYKMLSADEEYAFARRYRDHDDVKALVLAHRPLLGRLGTNHRHSLRHENFDELGATGVEDLVQEGTISLISPVRTFDPDIGVGLHYHARPRTTGAIRDFIMEK